ncbi:MAG: excisionase family protein [Aulosira sp. ZfuVER01]|nr:excisionase family protein [Aulosira sp. ZfuVER01]MDZ8001696.1 excisionase family protein [Aulosira sp. DedVER01a]MDZ8055202.1 excisionase family protein [Aulosira sp. ZfuCHP01]
MEIQFCSKRILSQTTGLSNSTFKKYRLSGVWLEGIHWQRLNSRSVLYNLPLILDWVANHKAPAVHQKAIENYLRSLPSNQKRFVRGNSDQKKIVSDIATKGVSNDC